MRDNRLFYVHFIVALFCATVPLSAQSLLDELNAELPAPSTRVNATFKANRVLLTQSVETRKKGTLELVFNTRYWNVPGQELRQTFGADKFSGHFGAQYAITDRLTFGAGYTTFDGILNGFGKFRLLHQSEDDKVPFGLTLVQGASYFTKDFPVFILPEEASDRTSFVTQAIFARKFDRNFSFQIVPTYIHMRNDVPDIEKSDLFALGFGARYKLGNHVSLASEYQLLFGRDKVMEGSPREEGFNFYSLGVNWEVSKLIIQFALTNAKSFDDIANTAITQNNFNFKAGGLHIGVGFTYVLHLKKQKVH